MRKNNHSFILRKSKLEVTDMAKKKVAKRKVKKTKKAKKAKKRR